MTASSPLVEADRCDSLPRDADGRREQLLVGLFCLLAGLRVLVYAAAFPFFNNVDEYDHFDTVCKYAQGHVPRGLEQWSDEAATFIALYGSPEFIGRFEDFPGGKIPSPVWTCSPEEAARAFERIRNEWRHQRNFEAVQPPAYYVVAGAWFDLGKLIGIRGGDLLYWTRIVSVLAYVLLVWLAYLLAKELFPQDKFLYLGVPAVLAVLAQTIYYGLDNDVLSGPLGTLVLYLLVRFYRSPSPSGQLGLAAGLATATAFLTKYTNAPLLILLGVVAIVKLWSRWRRATRTPLWPIVLLLLAVTVPVAGWLLRNYLVLGELTGFALKSREMGWRPKPLSEYGNHPIFTLHGCECFFRTLGSSLWSGETLWHRQQLGGGTMDLWYNYSSAVLLVAFAVTSVVRVRTKPREPIGAPLFCLTMVALYVALLIYFSISVDFGDGMFGLPTRQWPYTAHGRMMQGAVVPFLIAYLGGLKAVLDWLRVGFLRVPLLILLVDVLAIWEVVVSIDVFASQYNWYHLP